jgi:hypothetical protein
MVAVARTVRTVLAAVLLWVAVACGGDGATATEPGVFVLPASLAEGYDTAYIAEVVADPPGDDLAEGAGEHVVIANNATIRIDMGGWWLDVGDVRLPLGIGRQIDVGTTLRVHPGPGETDEEAVFVGLDEEVLDDDAGTVILRDAAGTEVARFDYPPDD